MNLYKIELNGLGVHYVVATDPTSAYQIIRAEYDRTDYGFSRQRAFREIELVAAEVEYPDNEIRLWIQAKGE